MARKIALSLVIVALAAGAWLFLAGRSGPAEKAGPRPLHLGEDQCGACLMIVSDARFAAERVLSADEVKVYDDPGCLLRELASDRKGDLYFTDHQTGEWLPAAQARFEPTTQPTPMGYGLLAVPASRAGAASIDLETAIRRASGATKEKN